MTALDHARYSRLAMFGMQTQLALREAVMFLETRRRSRTARRQRGRTYDVRSAPRVFARRGVRATAAGAETTANSGSLPWEFLGALLFCVVLPMVWLTGIAVAYVEHLR
jgi:hypothetical protein